MMTAFVALASIAAIFLAGICAAGWLDDAPPCFGWWSVGLLAFGLFGIYALIVGK